MPIFSPVIGKVLIHRFEGPSLVAPPTTTTPPTSPGGTYYSQLMKMLSTNNTWSPTPSYPGGPNFVVAMGALVGSSATVRVCRSTAAGQCLG